MFENLYRIRSTNIKPLNLETVFEGPIIESIPNPKGDFDAKLVKNLVQFAGFIRCFWPPSVRVRKGSYKRQLRILQRLKAGFKVGFDVGGGKLGIVLVGVGVQAVFKLKSPNASAK